MKNAVIGGGIFLITLALAVYIYAEGSQSYETQEMLHMGSIMFLLMGGGAIAAALVISTFLKK